MNFYPTFITCGIHLSRHHHHNFLQVHLDKQQLDLQQVAYYLQFLLICIKVTTISRQQKVQTTTETKRSDHPSGLWLDWQEKMSSIESLKLFDMLYCHCRISKGPMFIFIFFFSPLSTFLSNYTTLRIRMNIKIKNRNFFKNFT